MLELPGRRVGPHGLFHLPNLFLRETFGEKELPLSSSRILKTDRRLAPTRLLEAHRQHEMFVPKITGENDARRVALVQTLHDHDDGGIRVVDSARHSLEKRLLGRIKSRRREGIVHRQRVVDDDSVTS